MGERERERGGGRITKGEAAVSNLSSAQGQRGSNTSCHKARTGHH